MTKPYVFNQDSYEDLSSLAKAYMDDFDLGMQDIYTNTKELIRFIKSRINDKAKVRNYVSILSETKYKANALTFLIFEMTDHKEIYISGYKMDMATYIQALRENPDISNNALFNFLEDGGITKTFKVVGDEPKLCNHSLAIEKNFRNPFTYKYLMSYYDKDLRESLNAKVRQIAINGEECFRRFSKLATTDQFLISLAQSVGFTETIEVAKSYNPTFKALKLLKKETEEEYLRKIVDKSFFWWMMDNFDKYDYKAKASKVLKKYMDIKKDYDHYQDLLAKKRISSISLDKYLDLSSDLFDAYLSFVYYYHNNQIEVKRKFDPESFEPNKPYCKTYIPRDYMNGKIIKLYTLEQEVIKRQNPLTGEIIEEVVEPDQLDDLSLDAPVLILPEEKEIPLDTKRQLKTLLGQYGYSELALVCGFILLFLGLFMIVVSKFLQAGVMESLAKNYSAFLKSYALYIVFGSYFLVFLFAGIVMKKSKQSQASIARYEHLINYVEPKDYFEEEIILYNQEKQQLIKSGFRRYTFLVFLIDVFFGVLASFVAIFAMATSLAFLPQFGDFSQLIKGNAVYITLAFGAIFGLIFTLCKTRKNKILGILFILLTILGTMALLYFL